MQQERTVGDLMSHQIRTVHPREAIESAIRRLAEEGSRSAIVIDRGVPVGLFDSESIVDERLLDSGHVVEDVMIRDVPVLTPDMSIREASDQSNAAGTDRLPVIDEDGNLIGELTSEDLDTVISVAHGEQNKPGRTIEPRVIDANDPASVLADAHSGMTTMTTDGVKVGVVVDVQIESQGETWIVVEHGVFNKRRTMVDGSLVDLVDENLVILSIDHETFRTLGDTTR